ncbi:hypothetical protein VACV_IOC_B141_255 [Vaccinia virus]|uniref:Uncharacterized protein n=1 Tax=Vaccinia virus TaxID=10245 RepID=A0A0M5M2I2_VACCV|nr:hypothetical protein VACV_IOC_B141_001 [Vaccinia virus]ALF05225.1 hypothetical protein VACV_IOC_B141_255 [Vaccinia virus]
MVSLKYFYSHSHFSLQWSHKIFLFSFSLRWSHKNIKPLSDGVTKIFLFSFSFSLSLFNGVIKYFYSLSLFDGLTKILNLFLMES